MSNAQGIFTPSGVEAIGQMPGLDVGEMDMLSAASIDGTYEQCINKFLGRRIENYMSLPYIDRNALILQLREKTYPGYSYTVRCDKCDAQVRVFSHNVMTAMSPIPDFKDYYTGVVNGVNTAWSYYSIGHYNWVLEMWDAVKAKYPAFSHTSFLMLATLDIIGETRCDQDSWEQTAEFIWSIPAIERMKLLKVLPAFQVGGMKSSIERKCTNPECGVAVRIPLTFPIEFWYPTIEDGEPDDTRDSDTPKNE